MSSLLRACTLLLLPLAAMAKTDLSGCTSSETVAYGGASMIYWVPGTGEICSFLDCGGGRAPPMTTVPGCPGYVGTMSYEPSYMPGWGPSATPTPGQSISACSGTIPFELPCPTSWTSATPGNTITSVPTSVPTSSSAAGGNGTISTPTPSPFVNAGSALSGVTKEAAIVIGGVAMVLLL
jgi:hypothetical protein